MKFLREFCACIAGILLFSYSSLAFAGAWTLDPNTRNVISTTIIDRADQVFGPDIVGSNPNFSKFESGLYIEQGIAEGITLIGQSALQTVSFNNGVEQVSFNGFGNSSLGIRYGLSRSDKQVVSVELHGVVSAGGEDVPDGDLGRGGLSIDARILYGRNFKLAGKPGFLDVQLGIRPRLNSDPLEWRSDISAGVRLNDKLMVIGQSFYTQSNGTVRDPLDPVFATESLKGQLSLVYWAKPKLGLQFGAFTTLAGRNVVKEEALVLGIWQRY